MHLFTINMVNFLGNGTQEPLATLAEILAIYIYIPTIFIRVLCKQGDLESGRFITICHAIFICINDVKECYKMNTIISYRYQS
jgi:hypothetical protein